MCIRDRKEAGVSTVVSRDDQASQMLGEEVIFLGRGRVYIGNPSRERIVRVREKKERANFERVVMVRSS